MKMYNKKGAEVTVDKAQMQLMLDAGWSRKPVKKEEPELDGAVNEEEVAPKKIKKVSKKIRKKE